VNRARVKDLLLPGFFLAPGIVGWLATPPLVSCSALSSGRFVPTSSWGLFVILWAAAMSGGVACGGVMLWRAFHSVEQRTDRRVIAARRMMLISGISMGIVSLWFVMLPYRRPCVRPVVIVYLVWVLVGLWVAVVYAPRMVSRVGLVLFGIVLAVALAEISLRLVAGLFPESYDAIFPRPATDPRLRGPGYDVLFLEPDPVVGWTHPPNFQFEWAGRECREFRVQVRTNSYGFRAPEWSVEKPEGTLRIAVIGDSLVEAAQVPYEKTAVAVLEERLSQELGVPGEQEFEVMNFGVSNYGIGQYLMVYDEYVEDFEPDYVFILVAVFHMGRTVKRDLASTLQPMYTLNIRPSYEIDESGELVYLPAADYDEYVDAVQHQIEKRFGADRIIEIPYEGEDTFYHWLRARSYLLNLLDSWLGLEEFRGPLFKLRGNKQAEGHKEVDPELIDLNYRIIEELNDHVQANGGRLVLVDMSGFPEILESNRQFSEEIGAGYVNLADRLYSSPLPATWACDQHFNPLGNRIFAAVMFEWLVDEFETGEH
jgi:hypothetical protein